MFLCAIVCRPAPAGAADVGTIINRMEAAYAKVEDYQAHVEVKNFRSDGSVKVERFLYSFKKPKWIRLDMETPHPGMVLIYPDEKGKVFVRPGGKIHFPTLHLSPDSRLLKASSGQRLDQTEMGQLITKIAHSVTDEEKGPVDIIEEGGDFLIRVLAVDHFRPGVTTLYGFRIDKDFWLPVEVEEATPAGVLGRTVTFHMLRINTGMTLAFFDMGSG
jgi:outer membrane lipoprotein-sorting protein